MAYQNFLIAAVAVALMSVSTIYAIQVQHFGHLHNPPTEKQHKEEKQDLNKIPGVAGVDYPVYHKVPHTSFSCGHVPAVPGMYANVETGCQAYHVCHDGREGDQGASFLCTNGTIFNQKEFACDWWYNVKCEEAQSFYDLNADPEHNPYTPKKKIEEEHLAHVDAHVEAHDHHHQQGHDYGHGYEQQAAGHGGYDHAQHGYEQAGHGYEQVEHGYEQAEHGYEQTGHGHGHGHQHGFQHAGRDHGFLIHA